MVHIPDAIFLVGCLGEFAGISKPKESISGWILASGLLLWPRPVGGTRLFPSEDGSESLSDADHSGFVL